MGGQAARFKDETIPLEYGCIGQETTGPGGFAKALRTVPVVLELAEETARRGAPGAWFVDFTNPTGLVTQALLDDGHRAIGLCNVAIGFQRDFARHFGVEPERVQLEHVGLNHLTWERKVLVDGEDRLPQILDTAIDMVAEEMRHARGADPRRGRHPQLLPALLLPAESGAGRAEGPQQKTRAEEVMEIEAGLLEMYKDPTLDTKPKLLEERGGAFYSDAAAALIASLHAGTGDVQVVNVRNDGAIPNLPDDAVVEVAATVDADGAHPLPVDPLAPDMLALVQHAKAYELLTAQAATTGDRRTALTALITNPLVGDYDEAKPMLEDLLDQNRAVPARVLPQLSPLQSRGSSDAFDWIFARASAASRTPGSPSRNTFSMK